MYRFNKLIGKTVTIQPYCGSETVTGKFVSYEPGGYITLILPNGSRFRTGGRLV